MKNLNNKRKGIILAGGKGSRLYPVTLSVSKQILPIYDKPMIYYPLSTLMLAGIRDILIIVNPSDLKVFKNLLGSGDSYGINIKYKIQEKPNGIAEALIISENFLKGSPCALILGDNIFYGSNLEQILLDVSNNNLDGATIFSYQVNMPDQYGVVKFDKFNRPIKLIEKPKKFVSNHAVTGLYFYDSQASKYAKTLKPSKRGELEITDLNNIYLKKKKLKVEKFGRGYAWLDTGNCDNLLEASNFICNIERRQSLKISCIEEISFNKKWIDQKKLLKSINKMKSSTYANYLTKVCFGKNY
jgi:glucose-1-phosphate thymidylyltransferase